MSIYDTILSFSEESRELLNLIQKNGPVTINGLLEALHIGRSRLQNLLRPLEKEQLIIQNGFSTSSGGRCSVLYDVNCSHFFVLGIFIGSIRYGFCITDFKNRALAFREYGMSREISPKEFARKVHGEILDLIEELEIASEDMIGLGVSMSGAIDRKKGVLLRQSSNYFHPSWLCSPIRDIFEAEFKIPTFFDLSMSGEALEQYYYELGKGS